MYRKIKDLSSDLSRLNTLRTTQGMTSSPILFVWESFTGWLKIFSPVVEEKKLWYKQAKRRLFTDGHLEIGAIHWRHSCTVQHHVQQ